MEIKIPGNQNYFSSQNEKIFFCCLDDMGKSICSFSSEYILKFYEKLLMGLPLTMHSQKGRMLRGRGSCTMG